MPRYKVKDGELILFHGKHLKAGAIITATKREIEELKKQGIDPFIEIKYDDVPVKDNRKEDRPWMKSSPNKSKKHKISPTKLKLK